MKKFQIGLQPYTIREQLGHDYWGSLAKVAEIGYEGIEIGMPPQGVTIAEMKNKFREWGLQVIGSHTGVDKLKDGLDQPIAFLHEMGGAYLAVSHRFGSREEVLEAAKLFNDAGQRLKDNGIQFVYHNHDWEFVKFDGEYAHDILMRETDPELVMAELDVYWVAKGGEDPADYLRKLKGRTPVIHMKDMEAGEEKFFAEVGEGVLDIPGIIEAAEESGAKWLIVEQDLCRRSPLDCIATSYANLTKLGVV